MSQDNNIENKKQQLINHVTEIKNRLREQLDCEDRYLQYSKKETALLDEMHYRNPHLYKSSFIDELLHNQNVIKKQLEADKSKLQEQLQKFEEQLVEYEKQTRR